MKVRADDVIGTTDGRYGKVIAVNGNTVQVEVFPEDINEPTPEAPEIAFIQTSEVASIR